MFIAAAILSIVLAVAAAGAGVPKVLLKGDVPVQLQQHMGLSEGLVRFIGLAEVAATIGLVIGLFWQPLGIAAAAGFAVLMLGAIGFHAKSGDYADAKLRGPAMAPIVLAVVAIAAVVTLALSM
ncbi:DoxX family protein [Actinomadura scrupuli]|uniref:DoxX family protein n=1 Tax=Actinomadura scrupuli TaxID=559629 RepID=UPI003D957A06